MSAKHLGAWFLLLALLAAPMTAVAAGGAGHDDGHGLQLLKYATFNFILFVGLVTWKMKPVIRRFVQTRYDDITATIRRVETERAELQEQLQSAESALAEVDKASETLRQDIESAARTQAEKMLQDAKKQAANIERAAAQQIEAAERQAQAELLAKAAAMVTGSAEAYLHENVSDNESADLSQRQLSALGA